MAVLQKPNLICLSVGMPKSAGLLGMHSLSSLEGQSQSKSQSRARDVVEAKT